MTTNTQEVTPTTATHRMRRALAFARPERRSVVAILFFTLILAAVNAAEPLILKHIFDKFYRAGDEMTRKTKGSGLGLAIVKQILDSHRAQVKVNSRLNEGTEMIITFAKGARHA